MISEAQDSVCMTINLMGTICPLPILEVDALMERISVNEIVNVLVSDPATLADFPAWAKVSGHEIVSVNKKINEIEFLIKRIK